MSIWCAVLNNIYAKVLTYRLLSIIHYVRVWNEILEFGNDFY